MVPDTRTLTERLRDGLLDFGRHSETCVQYPDGTCACGLDDLIREATKEIDA